MSESKDNGKIWRIGLTLTLVLLLIPFGIANPVTPTATTAETFIVQSIGNGASYNALLSASSTIPFFTETNITTLVVTDILASTACTSTPTGCSIFFQTGNYSETAPIQISVANAKFSGTVGAVFNINGTLSAPSACGPTLRTAWCINANNVGLDGFTMEDSKRAARAGVTGDLILVNTNVVNCVVSNMHLQNASSTALQIQGSFCNISGNIINSNPFSKGGNGNFGINIAGTTATHIRMFYNTISGFNGSAQVRDTANVQISNNNVNFVDVEGNDIFGGQQGIQLGGGPGIPRNVVVSGNNIHDNNAAGILLVTPATGTPPKGGPLQIIGNTITNNGLEPGTDVQCNNDNCPGIMMRGTKAGWDSISIVGNGIRDDQAIHTQKYDIWILTQIPYTNLTIGQNTLGTTRTGTTIFLSVNPLASWSINDNIGFNPQPTRTVTITTNPFTYTNNDGYREQLRIDTVAGGLATVTCRGGALPTPVIGLLSPILNTLDICTFTGTTTDTFDVLPT